MLYYFRSNAILLLKGTQGTSSAKSRNFPREIKELPKESQGTSRRKSRKFRKEVKEIPKPIQETSSAKSRNFPREIKKLQERNPINSQSNLNFFAREGFLLRRGSLLISFGKSFGFALGRPLFCRGITIRLGAKSLHEKY